MSLYLEVVVFSSNCNRSQQGLKYSHVWTETIHGSIFLYSPASVSAQSHPEYSIFLKNRIYIFITWKLTFTDYLWLFLSIYFAMYRSYVNVISYGHRLSGVSSVTRQFPRSVVLIKLCPKKNHAWMRHLIKIIDRYCTYGITCVM